MRKLIATTLVMGWIVSLALPVAVIGSGADEVWPGFAVLIVGPLGVLVMQFAWFANLVLVPAIIFLVFKRPPRALGIVFAVLLVALAIDALRWDRIHGDNGYAMIQSYGAGYYLWLGVMLTTAAALLVTALTPSREEPQSVQDAPGGLSGIAGGESGP